MPIKNMIDAINFLRVAVGELGIQQMLILLTVMNEEGITQIELAERFGFQTGSISKNCKKLSLSKIIQDGKETTHGLNLIKLVPDSQQHRRLGCWLTARGKQIQKEINIKLGE